MTSVPSIRRCLDTINGVPTAGLIHFSHTAEQIHAGIQRGLFALESMARKGRQAAMSGAETKRLTWDTLIYGVPGQA